MVAITSTRKSGHKDSLFSEGRLWQRPGYHLFSGYTIALGITGLVTLISFVLLMVGHEQSINSIEQDSRQVQLITTLVQQTKAVRIQANHFLSTKQRSDFAVSELSLRQLQTGIDETITDVDSATQINLETIKNTSIGYTNTFRSLGTLVLSASEPAVQQTIRLSLDDSGQQLDEQTNHILEQTLATLHDSIQTVRQQSTQLHLGLLTLIVLTFFISIILATWFTNNTVRALYLIGQAAQDISAGHFNTRVALVREDEIGQLGAAFNHMAESLQVALQTETAASEQNRRQILKLARQERVNVILEERQRIARELHDSVKQQLFSITLASGAALNLLNHAPDLARTYLEHVQQAGLYAQSEMTTLLQELVPVSLQDQRLEEALLQYLHLLCETHRIKLFWRVEGTNTLTIAQEHALFRVIQESTANVIRHSKATILRVSVNYGLVTRVVVEDNGQGFDPEHIAPTSTGLATMRLRLKQVGGVYELHSAPDNGTRLAITVDLRKKAVQ